ncbi:MAG: type VI secretion system contractile sheath large subunit, partial [Spongiibacteraceae bacterium]|nr:type VI secretion system contractile sheath large subunit [Spongiibacteraceae bacterium]
MTLGYRVQNSECEVDCLPADKKIEQAANPLIAKGVDKKRWINRQIALIDEAICEQLNVILHEPRFQALESAWRGLVSLIEACDMLGSIKIRFLDVSWHDLSRDFERAPDFDQSRLFHLVYNEEFGSPGGEPYSVLLGDYQVAHRPYEGHPYDDVHTLQGIAQVAAASFSPFVCGAAAQLFGLDRFEDLGARIDFDVIFKQEEYIRWRSLRSSTDSRFLAVTLPGVLMRQPYCHHFSTGNGLRFKEEVGGPDGSRYLWGNAAYAFGGVLINAFSSVGWFTHIRGVASDELAGGLVSNFAAQSYRVDSTPVAYKILTPVLITDDTERSLSELGFIALCHCYQTPYAA